MFLFVYLLVFIDELSPKTKTRKVDANHQSAEASFSSSLHPGLGPGQDSHPGENLEFSACQNEATFSPLVEAEMMRIDGVLYNFVESPGEAPCGPHQTPQRVSTCKKSTGKFSILLFDI